MIEAKDLRIGNILMGHDKGVFTWDYEHFKWCSEGVFADEIGIPIILTEEWLMKLGFEKVEFNEWKILIPYNNCETSIEVNIEDDDNHRVDIWTEIDGRGAWVNTKNKYVHQLQNLYYSLTGEEL